MSKITEGFENKWYYDTVSRLGKFSDSDVIRLLNHSRRLEAVLKRAGDSPCGCPICDSKTGHYGSCELAGLIE